MTHTYDDNGEKTIYNYTKNQWEYEKQKEYINIHGNKTKICQKCNKPKININNTKDCDFCLQGLTTTDFIDNACCGHGNDELAYITLKDGRRFILDKKWNRKE